MDAPDLAIKILQYVALVLALCVHEFTHAALARSLGDSTAEEQGRLTLSPLSHVDPIGTVLLPIMGLFSGFPLFGWARPVPVQPANFRRGWLGRGQVLVAAGGPASNLVQALAWTAALALLTRLPVAPGGSLQGFVGFVGAFAMASILINLILAAFNILPIPPLDGGAVASWLLPRELGRKYDQFVGAYGFILLIAAMLPIFGGRSLLGFILAPAVWLGDLLVSLAVA